MVQEKLTKLHLEDQKLGEEDNSNMSKLFLFLGIVFFILIIPIYSINESVNISDTSVFLNNFSKSILFEAGSNVSDLALFSDPSPNNESLISNISKKPKNEVKFYRTFKNVKNKYKKDKTENYTIQVEIPENEISLLDLPNSNKTNKSNKVRALINFENIPVKSIEFPDLEIVNDTIELGIEELENESYIQSYAIDPEKLNFTNATVTVVASGHELYKCAEWNFSERVCMGETVLFMDNLTPGEEYTFSLYPKDPAFFEVQVDNVDNDARGRNGALQTTQVLRFGNNGGNVFDTYLRFTNVSVPFNSTIENAVLNLTSTANRAALEVNTNIFGLDEDNCLNFNTGAGGDDPTDNTRTTNFVAWDNVSAWSNNENSNNTLSPNISVVIQEIISRPTWSENNSICIVIEDDGSSTSAFRDVATIDEVGAFLEINYSEPPADLWWNRSFSSRYNLNITNSGSTDLLNFSAYYRASKEVEMQSDFDDVRFISGACDSQNVSELDYELEYFNSTSAAFWIRFENFSVGDNSLCVYYGNSTVSSTENPNSVWSSDYEGVWHLSEPGRDTRLDSTSNGFDAFPVNYEGDENVTGAIGGADLFDGTDDYLAISGLNYASSGAISEITVCALVRSSSSNQQIISSFDRNEYWRFSLKDDSGSGNVAWDSDDGPTTDDFDTITDFADGEWHYLCGWFNATAVGDDKKIFADGALVDSRNAHGGNSIGTGTTRFGFIGVGSEAGTFNLSTGPNIFFNGEIEEFRISSVALSDDWINQTFQLMVNQGEFTSLEGEVEPSVFSVELLTPTVNSSIVTQNQTLTPTINVSCSDTGDGCGDYNLTIFVNSTVDIGESGSVSLQNFESKLIEFTKSYSQVPIVVATPVTDNNGDDNSLAPVFHEINTTHMNISLCKDAGATTCASSSTLEDVHYMVFDKELTNGQSWIEVGDVSGSTDGSNTGVTFNKTFSNIPFVFGTPQTDNDGGNAIAPHIWAHSTSTTTTQIIGCDHPGTGDACAGTSTEKLGYVAIDFNSAEFLKSNSGTEAVDDSIFTPITYGQTYSNPRVVVLQNSDSGGQDPQYPWARSVTSTGAEVRYCEQDAAGVCNSHAAEDVMWMVLEDGLISLTETTFVEVSTISGETPVFTTSSNPSTGNLNFSESSTDSFILNFTGPLRTNYTFYAELHNGLRSDLFNVYIQGSSQVIWNTSAVNFSEVFIDEINFPLTLRVSSTNSNTNTNIICQSGNCSSITTNFTGPITLSDLEFEEIYFTCNDSVVSNYSAVFNVSSDQYQQGDLVTIGCQVNEKLIDIDLVDPLALETRQIIQNNTINVIFNVSCNDSVPCGDLNVSAAYSSRSIIGETGSVTFSNFTSQLITFDNFYLETPVVVAIPVTNNNADENSLVPVINSINTTHMNMSLCQDAGATTCDLTVLSEEVNYFIFDLDSSNNYSWIEVGKADILTDGVGNTISLNKTFSNTPIIFSSSQTYNFGPSNIGAHAWTLNVGLNSFDLIGCDHGGIANDCDGSSVETFGYVAIDPTLSEIVGFDSGTEVISGSVFTPVTFSSTYSNPRIVVLANTEVGAQDPAYPWARSVTSTGAEIRYCEQDAAGVCDGHSGEDTVWMVLEDGSIEVNESGSSLISTVSGATPLFTTSLNPQQVSLSGNDFVTVSFIINVSGPVDTSYDIFGILSNNDESGRFLLEVIGNPEVNWNASFVNFSLGFTNEIPTSSLSSISSIYGNTNVNVTCQSGNCSTITSNWTLPLSMVDEEIVEVLFTCSNLIVGNFSAIFNVSSDEFPQGDLLNLSCDMDQKLLDIDLTQPTPSTSLEVLQNTTTQIKFNVSCDSEASCGDLNVTLAYRNNSEIGEVGKVDLENLNSALIEFNRTYSNTPVVLLTTATDNNADNNSIVPVVSFVNQTHFNVSICKDSGNPTCEAVVAEETISYFVFDLDKSNSNSWIEVGRADILSDGLTNAISFNKTFSSAPFVFAWSQTDNDGLNAIAPTTWADSITTSGMDLIFCDHPSGAGATENDCSGSTTETVGYVVIDTTSHNLSNVSFGSESIPNSVWTTVNFDRTFDDGAVLVLVNSEVGAEDPAYPHARNIDSTGAQIRFCEQDGFGVCNTHSAEDTVWLAFETGSIAQNGSGYSVISNVLSQKPFFVNSTNPVSVNLNSGESQELTFYINNTGDFEINFEIFSFVNTGDDISESFFTKIIQPLDLFQTFFGFLSREIYLGLGNIVFFNFSNDSNTNLFIVDVDADIDWTNLTAIGFRTNGSSSNQDFLEIDNLFNHSLLYGESIQSEFAQDESNANEVRNITIFGRDIVGVPIVNSTNSTTFRTGILWDSSDDLSGNGEFDLIDNEDLIFVNPTNISKVGQFGTYDYEIKVPETLKDHKGSNAQLELFLDFR